jgi:pyridoxine/pyridoxamine 5'-phosphate oxidase
MNAPSFIGRHVNPLTLFQQWLDEAIAEKIPEPNAMTLATVVTPSTRIVLIKADAGRSGSPTTKVAAL